MQQLTWIFGGAALLASVGMGLLWIRAIVLVRMTSWLRWLSALSAAILAVSLATAASGSGGWPAGMALAAAVTPGIFLSLHLIARQPPGRVSVRVGGRVRDFEAIDARGGLFRLSSMDGKPYLLKFYRGHW